MNLVADRREKVMGKLAIGCAVLALAVLLVGGCAVAGTYNHLVGLDESVGSAWAQVENQYQRRADLVPNLVETVRGAAEFERDTFTAVTEARARVGQVGIEGAPDAAELRAFEAAQGELTSALSRLLLVVENYPDLKATQAFRDLQVQLEGTENRISVERRRFNEAARSFNTARRSFPAVFLAGFLGFAEKPYFESVPGADQAPDVQF